VSFTDALLDAARELELAAKNEVYKTDIRLWAKDKLGYTLWNKQVEIAEALIEHHRVVVKSGHGVGKSFTASVIMAWFIDTRRHEDALAVSTAPTQPQLGIIWEYLRDHHRKGKLFGRVSLDNDYRGDDDSIRGMGRKPSNTNEHAFQGQHRRNGVFAVIDEACGVPESLFTGVDVITTGKYDYCLAVGNPDDVMTPFGRIFTQDDPTWHKMTISSLDSPNFTGEDFPEEAKGGLVTPEWVEGRKLVWGEDSPRFRSKVLGEFSLDGAENTLFSQLTLAKGMDAAIQPSTETTPVLGCDVARFGSDFSAVYSNHDGLLRLEGQWSKADTVDTAYRIHDIAVRTGAKEVRVDGVGIGAGVYDQLLRLCEGYYTVVGMVGNAASPDLQKWANARAFWYDTMREKMAQSKVDMDDADKLLKEELEGIQYFFTNRGGIQIESKDDMKKRGVKSPDFADAAMYACADILIDPNDPVNQLAPGQEFELGLEDMLAQMEIQISPY
jgi:hypothetical protein